MTRTIEFHPLFDTYDEFVNSTDNDYLTERPSLAAYLDSLQPIPAREDYEHFKAFLSSYSGQQTTFRTYRTQIERLALWAWHVAGKSVTDLRRTDAEAYLKFCSEPPKSWIGKDVRKRFVLIEGVFKPNPEWRPFAYPTHKAEAKTAEALNLEVKEHPYRMAQASIKMMFTICNSFFDFLIQDGRTELLNPVRAIKQKSRYMQSSRTVVSGHSLTQLQWEFVRETAEEMADEFPAKHERTLFILMTLFSMYLRVSDVVGTASMGSFVKQGENWWYVCLGKGNVLAKVSVRHDYLPYLTRYRRFLGLSDLPVAGEKTPLLTSLSGRGGLTDRQVRRIIQDVFDHAAEKMRAEQRTEDEISALRAASLHWLRHTSATFDAEHRPAKHLQHDLRHKSMSTTQDIYYNSLDDERAASANAVGLKR